MTYVGSLCIFKLFPHILLNFFPKTPQLSVKYKEF
jgi:hypothetical protein